VSDSAPNNPSADGAPTGPDDRTPVPEPTQVRYLDPETCRIHLGTHGALHVTIRDERIYGGVIAVQAFPVAYPDGYISLVHTAGEDNTREIGIIRDLKEFPASGADLIRAALRRRYFIHAITKIRSIGWKYGFIAIDADTDKGPISFMMRWHHDRAVDYGRRGKVLIDVDENRYLIPDLEALPARERNDFQRYIYW